MRPMKSRWVFPVIFLSSTTGAVLFLVAACGDDSTGTGTGPSATTTVTTPAPTATPTTTATTTSTTDSGNPIVDGGSDADATTSSAFAGCRQILADNPAAQSGVYQVDLDGPSGTVYPSIPMYCDMTFDGGGWTLIQSYRGGADSPSGFNGASEDAGVLVAPPEPGKLGGLAGWVVKALAAKSDQVHIRLSFASDAGADAGTWVTTKVPDAGATTHAMQNLRDLNILTKGTDGGFEDWTGPKATAEKLAWFPLYGGNPGTCGNPVELQKYPSIYWACGNFTSMNILQSQSLCRWTYTGSSSNDPMEVYVR